MKDKNGREVAVYETVRRDDGRTGNYDGPACGGGICDDPTHVGDPSHQGVVLSNDAGDDFLIEEGKFEVIDD